MEMNSLRSSPSSRNLSTAFPTSPSLQIHAPRLSPLFTNEFRKVSLCAKPLPKRNCVRASIVQLEPSLKVKNKAVDLASELKGTSIFLVGMNGSMKTSLGKLLADALRYYYFDSDSLVVQAAGGESAAKSLKEDDEEGFQSSETEVLKQLSSMGRLVICAGDGAVQSSTNLAYLRYGISVWIDVPLDILAKEAMERGEYSPFTWPISASDSFPESQDNSEAVFRSGSLIGSIHREKPFCQLFHCINSLQKLNLFSSRETYSSSAASCLISPQVDKLENVFEKLSKLYAELEDGFATADARVTLQNVASAMGYDDVEAVTTEDMAMEILKEMEKLTRVKRMMEAAARPF